LLLRERRERGKKGAVSEKSARREEERKRDQRDISVELGNSEMRPISSDGSKDVTESIGPEKRRKKGQKGKRGEETKKSSLLRDGSVDVRDNDVIARIPEKNSRRTGGHSGVGRGDGEGDGVGSLLEAESSL